MSKVIHKQSKVIECDRCGKDFTRLTSLRTHFNNKNLCKPLLKNISIEELKEKYKIQQGVYKCENCDKEYKTKDGKYKHKKKCLLNPIINDKNEKELLKNELEEERLKHEEERLKREELEEQVTKLLLEKSENAKIINNNTTNNNTTNNTTNNILVFNFNGEKYDINELEKIILKNEKSSVNLIKSFIEYIHFNPEYPENHNLKLTNLKPEYKWIDIMINGKWEKEIQDKVLNTILNKLQKQINKMLKEIDPNFKCYTYDSEGDLIMDEDCCCSDDPELIKNCTCHSDLTERERMKNNYKLKECLSKSNIDKKFEKKLKNKAKITIYNNTKELQIK